MIIAVDTSMVDYALLYAISSDDDSEVNYICNRIGEAVPQMQFALVVHSLQRIDDYFNRADPDYLKASPLRRLRELLISKRAEFKEHAA